MAEGPQRHPIFGETKWDGPLQQWRSWIRLPLFTAFDASAEKAVAERVLRTVREADPIRWVEPVPSENTEEERRFQQGLFPLRVQLPFSAYPSGFWGRLRQFLIPSREPPASPISAQEQAYVYLMENEVTVSEAIKRETFTVYQGAVDQARAGIYAARDLDELDLILPHLDSPEGLTKLMRLNSVEILGYEKGGIAPVRFFFHCTWDEEHGCELYTWKDTISWDEP